ATNTPTNTPTATNTPTNTPTATNTPSPTNVPTATVIPAPTTYRYYIPLVFRSYSHYLVIDEWLTPTPAPASIRPEQFLPL
ncbi:hypothetical protein, partial [Chloroflexus islandicus]|uniref:hypothetical protein n=1 Tax=Chloroflexus islandicus TaxID=1707952 RepID=UPI000B262027